MSIKNIIQQENDLQEMSQQSLANYLNNPTGQYNPYLVAGELQRKEAFAQRQMTEAPQGTVVDELVAKTMPMGGMPQMPQPRPEEVMVSDTITETGIANLPAPNIGQNYAEGGIIGYKEGGLNKALDLIEKIPVVGKKISKKVKGIRDVKKIVEKKLKKKSTTTKPKQGELFPKVKPKVTKPKVTKPKVTKPKSKPGAVDRAILGGVGKAVDLGTTGIARTLAGGVRNPVTGIGALGLGAYFKNQYDESQEAAEAKKLADEIARKERLATTAANEAAQRAQYQANADEKQAARERQREKEMYLALALGGAKTMAGQSPFALSNVGEGLGAGVGALAAYDQNEMERMAASQAATAKAQQDMAIALADYTANYYKQINDLGPEASAEIAALDRRRDELIPEDYILEKESIYRKYVGISPADYKKTINGQTFYAAE